MAVYALLFWVIVRVIRIVAYRPSARTVTRSTREQTPGGPGNERTTHTILMAGLEQFADCSSP
jgi:hypothetical protein